MGLQKYTADKIYIGDGQVLESHVVIADNGKIVDVVPTDTVEDGDVQKFRGALTPGLINTHCHLELSHMKGLVNTGTGLLPFISSVVKFRGFPEEEILDAVARGDEAMRQEGIMAVGDISNTTHTADTKRSSEIRYHTFVEMFDFMQAGMTEDTFNGYQEVYRAFDVKSNDHISYVPHAPYTVSDALYEKVRTENSAHDITVSIHNQETPAENALFEDKKGDFLAFYDRLGFSLDAFEATGQGSIYTAMAHMDPSKRTLFVHNTMTRMADIQAAKQWSDHVYWATCANANLYIENRLPKYQEFIDAGATMTIGTDSLTSNWQLSIVEEMKTIQKYCRYVEFDTLIQWATSNGAKALGFEDTLGTLEVGKTPGLIHWDATFDGENRLQIQDAITKRIV